jgi:hypothetical protein
MSLHRGGSHTRRVKYQGAAIASYRFALMQWRR